MSQPSRKSPLLSFLLGTVLAATFVLGIEGALSLSGYTTLRERFVAPSDDFRAWVSDAERSELTRTSEGNFRAHIDPLVGFQLKGSHVGTFQKELADGTPAVLHHMDEDGMRVRVGPEPDPNSTRIVVLGDSVAFGMGVGDEETLGSYLESWLRAVTDEAGPAPVVRTIACPGWSLENSFTYLSSNLDRLNPDIVIFVPVPNDIDDGMRVTEGGYLFAPAFVDGPMGRRPHITAGYAYILRRYLERNGASVRIPSFNAPVLAGATPESRRRYRNASALICRAAVELEQRGARFAFAPLEEGFFVTRLMRAMEKAAENAGSKPVVWPLFRALQPEDRLVNDAHPNGTFNEAAAWRMAQHLLNSGWLPPSTSGELPRESERYRDNVADLERTETSAPRLDELAAKVFGPTIDFASYAGLAQLYGGVWPDATAGPAWMATLARDPNETPSLLADASAWVVLRGRARAELVPLEVVLEVNGVELASHRVADADEDFVVRAQVELPEEPIDVVVRSSRWLHGDFEGTSRLMSFDLRTLSIDVVAH